MMPQRGSAPPGRIGRGADETVEAGNLKAKNSTVFRLIQFQPPRQPRCTECGANLPWKTKSTICEKHIAEDMLLRAMSLRRQALGMLARAGG